MHRRLQGGEDVGVSVVAYGAGPDPADMYIGEIQGAGELTFEGRPQCATVSPSKNPGDASTSSVALRILTEDRSNS